MYTGPHIIKDGLVFGYDTGYGIADNVTGTRFYPGKPGTNLVTGQATAFSNWSGLTGTSTYYTTAEGNQGVHLITTSGGGVQFYSSPTITGISASTQYTVSATIKYSGTTPHPNLFYVRQYHNGSQITEGGQFSTGIMVDLGNGWYRAYRTFTTTSTTSYINLQGYQYSSGVNLKIQDLQFELGGSLTPYNGVNGTRSSTASLIDLKETIDIDVSSMSFDSTGQPEFDGTDDILYANAENDYPYPYHSWEVWFKTNQVDSGGTAGLVGLDYGRTMYLTATNGGNIVYTLYSNMSSPNVLVLSISGGTNLLDNEWHQVVCSRGASAAEIWVDGSLVKTASNGGQATWNGINQWSGMAARFGDNPNNSGLKFTGPIPIIKIYNKQLSGAEVLQNYNAQKSRFGL